MLNLRPTTNLKTPANLILNGDANRSNFLFLYNSLFPVQAPVMYALMAFRHLAPMITNDPKFGKDRKVIREITSVGEKGRPEFRIAKGLMRITKELAKNGNEPHFQVSLPLFFIQNSNLKDFLMGFVRFGALTEEEKGEMIRAEVAPAHSMDTNQLVANMAAFPKIQSALIGCHASLTVDPNGYVFLNVRVKAAEAQQLTTTQFDQIRPSDLYAVLQEWAVNLYGFLAKPPKSAFAITKIAQTLPKSEMIKPSVNEEMVTIDGHGKPLMIPRDLNAASVYDQKYFDAGVRDDGSFQLLHMDDTPEQTKARRLPSNMPVLVDWANGRFAYTDTLGHLKTLDLTKCRVPNATHLVRLASQPISEQIIKQIIGVCRAVGMPEFKPNADDVRSTGAYNADAIIATEDLLDYIAQITPLFIEATGYASMRWRDISSGEFKPLNEVAEYIRQGMLHALRTPEVIYQKYSVMYAVQTLPYFLLITHYGSPANFANLVTKDNATRKAYYEQRPDENWKGESLPLAGDSLGQLPHQARIRNQMRNFPMSAILPVQAGGGKTPIIIMDILKFVKAKKGFPYLIMCPSHLVAQYVSEIAFFTGGKLNPVPINTASCNTNGLERLTRIIQTAPRNTVVIVDYDVCSRIATDRVVYGNSPVNVYHIIEFLKQFDFQYVACDEAHYLRRASSRTEAVQRLITEIPYKRLASGTFAHDSVSDLASQLSLIDPTMFGTRDEFNARYGLEIAGGRVKVWRPGAEAEIKGEIKRNMVEARAYRKEWAALLPPAVEQLHVVGMTEAQMTAYNALVNDVLDEMKEKAKTNPLLKKWLAKQAGEAVEEGEEGEDAAEAEINAESLEQLLKKYLARVERFCTAMGRDDWGKANLSGPDLVSPKITKIIDLIREHESSGTPGKIIVFTNYIWSAQEIYAALPADIKARFVLYTAGKKTECMAKFEAEGTLGMVGVSASMDTGLNLQSASRLIRDGLVWNPGTLEQGDSRIGRPQLKVVEKRDRIYYDTVLLDGTIDVTKMCRIYSKLLSVSKYDNSDDPKYGALPDLPVISMKFDSLNEYRFIKDKEVAKFYEGYSDYKYARDADYKEYRERYAGDNRMVLEPVEHAPMPEDASILEQTPYIPGYDIAHKDALGLVRLDHYLNENITISEGSELDDDTGEDDAVDQSAAWVAAASELVVGAKVHTQNGEGEILKIGPNTVSYVTLNGVRASQRFSTVFLMKKPLKGGVRRALATYIKMPLHVVENMAGTKAQQRAKPPKLGTGQVVAPPQEVKLAVEIWPVIINGFLCLEYIPNGDDDPNTRALQAVGFRAAPPYKYAEIKHHQHLLNQMKMWAENGLKLDPKMPELNDQLKNMWMMLKSGKKLNTGGLIRFATQTAMTNFMRQELKPNNDPNIIRPFPLIENDGMYLVLPVTGQLGTRKAMQLRRPLTKWFDGPAVLQCWTLSVQKSVDVVKNLINSGVQIANVKELERDLKALRKAPVRSDDRAVHEMGTPKPKTKK